MNIKGGMMRLPFSLDEMRSRGFSVISGEGKDPSPSGITTDGLWLIRPAIDKNRWDFPEDAPFREDSELCWRSAVVDDDLGVVSLGLPKFLNFHEPGARRLDGIISDSMANGRSVLTAKLDGTLIIRSVWNGRVILRTRNSFFLGPFEPQVRRIVEEHHPILLDPDWLPHLHLHFEFVSPRNMIIIHYPRDEMILIHAREGHRMASWDELKGIARDGDLRLVEDLMMDVDDPSTLQRRVSELETLGRWDHEGIVIRDQDTGTMVKIKGDEYISKFRIRFHFSWDDFVEVCLSSNATSEEDALAILSARGVDWELLPDVRRWWEIMAERKTRCQEAMSWASRTVRGWTPSSDDPRTNRKDLAGTIVTSAPSPMARSMAFMLADGKDDRETLDHFILKEMGLPIGQDAVRGRSFTLEES